MSLLKLLREEDKCINECDYRKSSIEYWVNTLNEERNSLKESELLKIREEIIFERIAREEDYLEEAKRELSNVRKEIAEYFAKYIFTERGEEK